MSFEQTDNFSEEVTSALKMYAIEFKDNGVYVHCNDTLTGKDKDFSGFEVAPFKRVLNDSDFVPAEWKKVDDHTLFLFAQGVNVGHVRNL